MYAITLNSRGNNHNSKHCTPSSVFLSSGQFLLPYRRATFQFFSIKLGASPCVPTTATSRLLFWKHIYKMLFTRPRRHSPATDILLRMCKVYFRIEQKSALSQRLCYPFVLWPQCLKLTIYVIKETYVYSLTKINIDLINFRSFECSTESMVTIWFTQL